MTLVSATPSARLAAVATGDDISAFLDAWLQERHLPKAEAATFDEYYRSYRRSFGPYLKHHYRNQTREIMTRLQQEPGLLVLEVGCGCGTESLWLASHGARVTAVDVSRDLLSVAAARKQVLERCLGRTLSCEFRNVSITDLDGGPYDLIWMEQAFHHLEPRAQVAQKIGALLRPGGHLIVSEANAWNLLQQFLLFQLRGTRTIITHNGVMWGHERVLTAGRLRREFEPHGIEQVAVRYFRMLPNRGWADWLTARIGFFDDADRWWVRLFYTHYNYVGRKRD